MQVRPSFGSLTLLLSGAVLNGCSVGHPSVRPAEVKPITSRLATIVTTLPSCPVSGYGREADGPPGAKAFLPPAAVLGPLVPMLANVAIGGLIARMERQQAELSASYIGRGAGPLLGADGKPSAKCLILARGRLGPELEAGITPDSRRESLDVDDLKYLGLATWPDLYMEVALDEGEAPKPSPPPPPPAARRGAVPTKEEPVPEDRVLMRPVLLHYGATAAKRSIDDAKGLGIVLLLAGTSLDPKAKELDDDALVAKVPLVMERLPIGSELRQPMKPAGDPPVLSPPLGDLATVVAVPQELRGDNLNLYALVTETENPDELNKLLLEALKKDKDKISEALAKLVQQILTPAPETPKPAGA